MSIDGTADLATATELPGRKLSIPASPASCPTNSSMILSGRPARARIVADLATRESLLLLDEILDLENLRFGRELDAHVAKDGHQLLTVSLELLARAPYLART
jgi:hypothetical protein